jgi:hypothetical protein
MTRWLIWSQVGFAIVCALATFADQGALSRSYSPPQVVILLSQVVIMLCAWSALIVPSAVLYLGRRRKPGSGQTVEAIASVGLGFATLFALLPLVQ